MAKQKTTPEVSDTQNNSMQIDEEKLYELAWSELHGESYRPGLWAKAISESLGDEKKAEALYIRYRIPLLRQEYGMAQAVPPTPSEQILQSHHSHTPSKKRGLAIASFIFGILQISILAIIFGHISLHKIKKYPKINGGKGLAMTGVILGYVGLVLMVVVKLLSINAHAELKKNLLRKLAPVESKVKVEKAATDTDTNNDAVSKIKVFATHDLTLDELKEKAATGDHEAQFRLALFYNKGEKVKQDYAKAFELYQAAARQGNAAAKNNLGVMYAKGQGVEKNDKTAVLMYSKSAKLGYSSAQNNLGVMYYFGRGTKQNYFKAAACYRTAAEQGFAPAQYNLGLMYAKGRGVKKNIPKAMKWYEAAAEQGYNSAQYALGKCYYYGANFKTFGSCLLITFYLCVKTTLTRLMEIFHENLAKILIFVR